MEFKLNSISRNPSYLYSVFFISNATNENEYQTAGYPFLYITQDAFVFSTFLNNSNYRNKYVGIMEDETYHIIMQQSLKNGEWMYEIYVDGALFISRKNRNPLTMETAKFYLTDPWWPTAKVEFSYFRFEY